MKLTKWSTSVDIGVESPIILIWISFPNLRPHLYFPLIHHGLGSLFGHPLKVYNATSIGSRPSVVCVLVELGITKNFPNRVWLGPKKFGYIQHVEMEDFPPFCIACKFIGHSKGEYLPQPSSVSLIVTANDINHVSSEGNAIGVMET
ncbi:hypothetical protein IEQ34_013548 [Dendrobium chrysotoxum]|uniref:DUF4283 domain-containing protein n=1 Tax=Dendrobium chrysotoxum TaxID=161865 RepID=A0AAV7GRB2_DENCH|nr:hypothetical protein IEQ34_013548 [Dendrobium chrysotoxum]